jgi:ubiquinone/menaquinone biosynthesis C-methylase UbiE
VSYFKYDRHEAEWQKVLSDPSRKAVGEAWFRDDTLDAWRHARLREPLKAFIEADADASWLTVGDGRFGTDAHFLLRSGAKQVHCSDISDTLLKVGAERGYITAYSAQNAEALGFADGSFDFVYCKESFHHFPRPYLALYEMFRVARKAVILTEPRDQHADWSALLPVRNFLAERLGRRTTTRHEFEPVGNYVYALSERELEKFLLGMHYAHIALIGCNDAYAEGVELVPMDSPLEKDRRMKKKILSSIRRSDLMCRLGLKKPGFITAALFKQEPTSGLAASLRARGWELRQLPSTPYR